MNNLNDPAGLAREMDLKQALDILRRRRVQDILDTIDAADLFANLLTVLREDVYSNQVLEIRDYLKRLATKEPLNALDIIGRAQTHPQGPNAGQTETMGLSRELGSEANRRRSLSDPASERGSGEGTRQHKDRS